MWSILRKPRPKGKDPIKLHNYCYDNNNNTKICLVLTVYVQA